MAQNLSYLLSPERAVISEIDGIYHISNPEMETIPEPLPKFINRFYAGSDFVQDIKRMRYHQREHYAHKRDDDLKKAKTLEYKIDQTIIQLLNLLNP